MAIWAKDREKEHARPRQDLTCQLYVNGSRMSKWLWGSGLSCSVGLGPVMKQMRGEWKGRQVARL